ncbi:MAG: hypothetical protein OIF50_14910 [Flavobacteriaceae bacterium]|nr:hypothetical protein [Flavobacteriaceae bacterium]
MKIPRNKYLLLLAFGLVLVLGYRLTTVRLHQMDIHQEDMAVIELFWIINAGLYILYYYLQKPIKKQN